jgi:hypothetical protein
MTVKTDRPKPEVVTSENLAEYQARNLDIAEAPKIDDKQKESVPLAEVKVEPKIDPKADDKENKKDDEEQEKKKTKMSERMHELAERARKAEERAEAADKKAKELEEKYSKPKVDEKKEEDKKPKREDFSDAFEYAEKLADWTVRQRLKEQAEAQEKKSKQEAEEKRISSWNEKLSQARKDIPDYDETLDSSKVLVSEEVKEAILESDVGPKILLHLAKNPDEAEKIAKMTVGNAYKAIGRIEAKIQDVPPPKEEEKPKVEPKAEVSKAPPPISPLKGASAPVDTASKFTENKNTIVSSTNNLAEYKEARRSGKIK